MYAIYTVKADAKGTTWDEVIANNELEIVETFDSYNAAHKAFDDKYGDEDKYCVGPVND